MAAGFQLYTFLVSFARVAWFQYYNLAGIQWISETTVYSCTEGVRNRAVANNDYIELVALLMEADRLTDSSATASDASVPQ